METVDRADAARRGWATRRRNQVARLELAQKVAEFQHHMAADPIAAGLRALHSLNRAAKHQRFNNFEIYERKDRLLLGIVVSGGSQVYSYDWTAAGYERSCACGQQWNSRYDDLCRACGAHVAASALVERWYIVSSGPYRFHVAPRALWELRAQCEKIATPIEPHDPSQPPREIPDGDIPSSLRLDAIDLAIEALGRMANDPVRRAIVTQRARNQYC
ncbi:hypothetical protein [Sandaracinus amylolyticus]|uniref:hypothetical protein n=1 Tax=Sandaracinus amylolyticus TaxID=927083 RepID=UPI001F446A33|nr:hypothetical protein [Sandaracinus amylolyticus]